MFTTVLNYLKQILHFFQQQPEAQLEWRWARETAHEPIPNQGDIWIPRQLDYYLPNQEQPTDDGWTTERLISMSESLGKAYAPGIYVDRN